jgi:DNA primase
MNEKNLYTNFEIENANVLYGEYEFFRKRIIIPIIDDEDNVVGFSGRSTDGEEPKYINSKDSKIFQKKNILYNMNRARKYLNDESIIIVEGYFDVIALSKIGINNVVAIMGTAFGFDHIKLLKKYKIKNVILCLDQDEAGVKSSLKIGEMLLKNNIGNINVITYDEHKDIDEYIKSNDNVEQLFNSKKDYFEFKIDKFKKYYDLTSVDGKMSYLNVVANGIDQINPTKMNMIKLMISDVIGLDVDKVLTLPKQNQPANVADVQNYDNNEYNVEDNYIPPPTDYGYSVPEVPQVLAKYKTDVPTDEDALVQYALMNRKNCHEVLLYAKQNDFKFSKYQTLFDCITEYYEVFESFDLIEFMNISHPNDFIDVIKRMQSNEAIDMEKIHLIFNNNKQRVAGINMFRKKSR